jgi:hypothetical protein
MKTLSAEGAYFTSGRTLVAKHENGHAPCNSRKVKFGTVRLTVIPIIHRPLLFDGVRFLDSVDYFLQCQRQHLESPAQLIAGHFAALHVESQYGRCCRFPKVVARSPNGGALERLPVELSRLFAVTD